MFMSYLSHGAPKIDPNKDELIYAHDPATNTNFGVYFEGITNLDKRIFSDELNEYATRTTSDARDPKLIQDSLIAYSQGIDIPEISLKIIDKTTTSYHHIKIPGNADYGSQTTTIRFYDTSTGLLFRFFRNWFLTLRRLNPDDPKRYDSRPSYGLLKCNAIVFIYDITISEITFACGFLGLMPSAIPSNSYSVDVHNRTYVILNQQFTYDKIVIDDHIFNYCYNTLLPMFANHDGVIQWEYK